MICADARARWAALKPPDPLGSELEAHVRNCSSCERLLEADRLVWRALGEWSAPPVSAGLLGRMEARLRPQPAQPMWFALAAACLALLGVSAGALLGGALQTHGSAQARAAATPSRSTEPSLQAAFTRYFDLAPARLLDGAYAELELLDRTP